MSIADVEKGLSSSGNGPSFGAGRSGIKSIWDSRLRPAKSAAAAAATPTTTATAEDTPKRQSLTEALQGRTTPSSAARAGLTESPAARTSSRSSAPRHVDCTDVSLGDAAASAGSSTGVSVRRRVSGGTTIVSSTRKTPRTASRTVRQATPLLAKPLFSRPFLLPELEPHEAPPALTLVLDLDETLVSNRSSSMSRAVLRPYCLHVLNALTHMKKRNLEIVLWTASTKDTAAPVVEQLHESGEVFDEVIFRNAQWFTEPLHTKDLRLLGRDMNRVVIVDNAANCCKLNQRNAILIEDFHGYRHTEEASLVNVYYIVEALLDRCRGGASVQDVLPQLSAEGHLCHSVFFTLPEAWRSLPLSEIAPIKIPPCGRYVKANKKPPNTEIMKHWTY